MQRSPCINVCFQPLTRMRWLSLFLIPLSTIRQTTAFTFVRQSSPFKSTFPSNAETSTCLSSASTANNLQSLAQDLNDALAGCQADLTRTCHVRVAAIDNADGIAYRLGMVATRDLKAGETVLQMPFDERFMLTADVARKYVLSPTLHASDSSTNFDEYTGWTGDAGLIALQLLQELARASGVYDSASINKHLPVRDASLQAFMNRWVMALPTTRELSKHHPLLWPEEDQEILQSSSTNKIYRRLDDLEEDFGWLAENIFVKHRKQYPEAVVAANGETMDCFNLKGFKWALANTLSRTVFVDGALRLLPIFDFFNHHDEDGKEVELGYMGAFKTMKGAQVAVPVRCRAGEQVFCSYGPKSAAEYLLEHGFCSKQALKTAVAEVTLELDPDDRFYDDKLDILEFETYDQAPMDPVQKFDLISAPGRDGDPDPAMIQFVRLCKLGGADAFLLESIFRKEAWDFMALPVSEANELQVINAVTAVCQAALDEFDTCSEGGPEICTKIRQLERKALSGTMEYLLREKEALDLKEYYQQRRLKDLGLDSPWTPEDDPDIGYGQTRAPGSADYDW
ncbi:hypothetical protein MPSEU_000254300 [Mayamaea pseudoterrestris]|nr:hypothetical protein MPSEU_000254300 [Mayamaea pseudoterrestris]